LRIFADLPRVCETAEVSKAGRHVTFNDILDLLQKKKHSARDCPIKLVGRVAEFEWHPRRFTEHDYPPVGLTMKYMTGLCFEYPPSTAPHSLAAFSIGALCRSVTRKVARPDYQRTPIDALTPVPPASVSLKPGKKKAQQCENPRHPAPTSTMPSHAGRKRACQQHHDDRKITATRQFSSSA